MYRVLVNFYDHESQKFYKKGDEFPNAVPKKRLAQLLAKDAPERAAALKGAAIIKEIKETKEDKQ